MFHRRPEKQRSKSRAQKSNGRQLRYEPLEDRRVLAILTVNTLADGFAPGDGLVTLREAITAANFDLATDLGAVGAGPDTIVFTPALSGGTIALLPAPFGGTLPIMSNIVVDASGLPGGLTIDGGDGADLLPGTADGFSVFTVNDFIPGPPLTVGLIGLTITGGDQPLDGGAIYNEETLTVTGCTITANAAGSDGGGIYNMGGVLTVMNTTIVGNTAGGGMGGGIASFGPPGSVTVTLSNIVDNSATISGGGIAAIGGAATITNSTVSGNSAGFNGGGLVKFGMPPVTVTGSTFNNNSAAVTGGGIAIMAGGTVTTITNSTISGNTANVNGGGIYQFTGAAGASTITHCTITANVADADGDAIGVGGGMFAFGPGLPLLDNTIVAANLQGLAPAGPFIASDIGGPGLVNAFWSLVGIDTTGTIINLFGTSLIGLGVPIAPLLAPLSNNGGPTLTHRLLPGSPAIDSGNPAFVGPPFTDQRGAPFLRVANGDALPGAITDMGAYELQSLFPPAPLMVSTLVDESDGIYAAGDLSLREAIGLANGNVGFPNVITFAPALSGGVIELNDLFGELDITEGVAIDARALPGGLTIDAGNGPDGLPGTGDGFRIFNVESADPAFPAGTFLGGLTMTGGDVTGVGGAIRSVEMLTLSDCTVTGNTTSGLLGFGGGVYAAGPFTMITGSTISGNSTTGGFGFGGGVASVGTGTLTVTDSTIAGNATTAPGAGGGGIWAATAATITGSTISGNTSAGDGGGILDGSTTASLAIESSTISGNTAAGFGGGISTSGAGPATTVTRSTVTLNTAGAGGGGIAATGFFGGTMALDHTIVAANAAVGSPDVLKAPPFGSVITANYSLIGVATPGSIVNLGGTSLIGTAALPIAPMLAPLAANGGPTMTHDLLVGSPAIDAGDPLAKGGVGSVPMNDQRGAPFTRVYDGNAAGGAVTDIGAVEYHAMVPVLPTLLGDYNGNGTVDAADSVVWRNTFGAAGVPAYSGADGDGDGTIDDDDYYVWRANFGNTLAAGAESGEEAAVAGAEEAALQQADIAKAENVKAESANGTEPSGSSPELASANVGVENGTSELLSVVLHTPVLTESTVVGAGLTENRLQVADFELRTWDLQNVGVESQVTFVALKQVSNVPQHDDGLLAWLASQPGNEHEGDCDAPTFRSGSPANFLDEDFELGALDTVFESLAVVQNS